MHSALKVIGNGAIAPNQHVNDRPTQLALFPGNGATQSPKPTQTRPTNPPRSSPRTKPKISIERVPQRIALGDSLYYIFVNDFKFAIQLSVSQVQKTLALIDKNGDRAFVWLAIEQAIEGGLD